MKIFVLVSICLTVSLNAFAVGTCPMEAIAVTEIDAQKVTFDVLCMSVESSVRQETFLYTDAGKLTNYPNMDQLVSQVPITEGSTKNLPTRYYAGSLQDRYSAAKALCGAGTIVASFQGKYKGNADLWSCYKSCP
jgi:hypothetical protein